MAVLTIEAPGAMWPRVDTALGGVGTQAASPCARMLFRAYKSWLMQHLRGINLQMLPISDLTDDVNDLDGAVRVYAIYLKKPATATDAYYKLFDDATNSGTAGDEKITVPLLEAGEEAMIFYPNGLSLADGIVQTSHTTSSGTTDSTSGDGPNGFMLVG